MTKTEYLEKLKNARRNFKTYQAWADGVGNVMAVAQMESAIGSITFAIEQAEQIDSLD